MNDAVSPGMLRRMEGKNPLVVGVLGGMGSYSTLHFFEQLLDAFPADREWERPRVIIDNNCVLPSRVRAILYGERRQELVAGMADSITRLLTYDPDVIAVTCNTAHSFLAEVRALRGTSDDRIVDLLEIVASDCAQRGLRDAFLLATEGTIAARDFERTLTAQGIGVRCPSETQLARVRVFIEQVKQRVPLDLADFAAFVGELPGSAIVLGCTELSAFHAASTTKTLVDPIALLVARIRSMAPPPTSI